MNVIPLFGFQDVRLNMWKLEWDSLAGLERAYCHIVKGPVTRNHGWLLGGDCGSIASRESPNSCKRTNSPSYLNEIGSRFFPVKLLDRNRAQQTS